MPTAHKFGTYRNVAAHVPVIVFDRRILADPTASRLQAGLRFRHINHETFWRLLSGDLLVLAHYARQLAKHPFASSLRKPPLRSLRAIQEIESPLPSNSASKAVAPRAIIAAEGRRLMMHPLL